jgi:hypothetical protein
VTIRATARSRVTKSSIFFVQVQIFSELSTLLVVHLELSSSETGAWASNPFGVRGKSQDKAQFAPTTWSRGLYKRLAKTFILTWLRKTCLWFTQTLNVGLWSSFNAHQNWSSDYKSWGKPQLKPSCIRNCCLWPCFRHSIQCCQCMQTSLYQWLWTNTPTLFLPAYSL